MKLTVACLLLAAGCSQIVAFEQKAGPEIAKGCATFHAAKNSALIKVGAFAANLAYPGVGTAIGAVAAFGDAFCKDGPPAGDTTTVVEQLGWLQSVSDKLAF